MKKQQIENKMRNAFEALSPQTDFEDIRRRMPSVTDERSVISMTTKKKNNIIRLVAPAVAACLILAAGLFGGVYYADNLAVDSVVDIDVNPAIELTVNRQEKVLDVTAVNEDGVAILDGMDLKKADLQVAVNALLGSMVKQGYVADSTTGILVSVQNKDAGKAEKLQKKLTEDINKSLTEYDIPAPVINQTFTETDTAKALANKHGISVGKATFVQNLAAKNEKLNADELANMNIQQLTQVVVDNRLDISDIADYDPDDSVWENIEDTIEDDDDDRPVTTPTTKPTTPTTKPTTAYDKPTGIITPEAAKAAALKHAGLTADQVTFLKAELETDDGNTYYDVEFTAGNIEYEYAIHRHTGEVLKAEKDIDDDIPTTKKPTKATTAKPTGTLIGVDKAKAAALKHAGLTANQVRFEDVELERDDGLYGYHLEFESGNTDYDYVIHPYTGAVLRSEKELDDDKPTTTKATSTARISAEKAKTAALKHAGLTANQVVFDTVELDEENGVYTYEVEFHAGQVEYSYDIDAATGKVLHFEKDIDD